MKVVLLLGAAAEQSNDPIAAAVSRELCGPIAVQTVLRHFGRDVTLPELTEDVFGENRERFSSMAALSDSLQRHGVHTLALEIGKDNRIDWREPVIMHLPPSSQGSAGHFAVMLPNRKGDDDDRCETVSLSSGTTVSVPWRGLSAARSRIVLLTSAGPIDRRQLLAEMNRAYHWNRWALALVVGAFVTGSCFHLFHRRGFR